MAATLSTRVKRLAFRWHQLFAIIGGVALLLWGGSGLLHPLMTAFGPQQAVFMPPVQPVDLQGTRPIAETLAAAGIARADAIRLVPSPAGQLWQVTQGQDHPRRYFQPESGAELVGHDSAQAVWLARHWLGQPDTRVKSVILIERFSADYPAVNRLLPVWKVEFDRADGLSGWIYTETGAAAAVSNHWKSGVQRWFQWLHTWSFLPRQAEWARVILVAALVGSLFLMAASGVGLLVAIRHRKRLKGVKG